MSVMQEFLGLFAPADYAAFVLFVIGWSGYEFMVDRHTRGGRGLRGVTHGFRMLWGKEMVQREVRIVDSSLTGILMNSAQFYANTTIYIIAGMIAVAGTLDPLMQFTGQLPFARAQTRQVVEAKLFVLIAIFVFAYFKFTWALRQFNILTILIGAAPSPTSVESRLHEEALRFGSLNTLAGDEFNDGIRAYYFGFAALSWFVNPWTFMVVTVLVVVILWRRDFRSDTLAVLRR